MKPCGMFLKGLVRHNLGLDAKSRFSKINVMILKLKISRKVLL